MHFVTRANFRLCDNDGGQTIRSAIAENPMLYANFIALCFIEPELLPIKVLQCRNRNFLLFCSCDLDLDPMIFICELHQYFLEIYRMCNELPTSRLSKVIVRQTDRHDRNYIPRRFTDGHNIGLHLVSDRLQVVALYWSNICFQYRAPLFKCNRTR